MRISYFNYHHDIQGMTQGAAVQIQALTKGLEQLGHQVDLRFLAAYHQGETAAPPTLKNIRWLRRYGHVPRLLARNISFYRRELDYLRKFRPDVVLAVSSYGTISMASSSRRLGLPLVLFCEAPLEYEYSLFLRQYYSYPCLGRWLEGVTVRQARRVVCISEVLKGYLMRYGAPAVKFAVIPNGVDHHRIRSQTPDQELQLALGLQKKLVIGFVGSFQFFAQLDNFVKLAQTICNDYPEVVFLFVGGGETAQTLQRLNQTVQPAPRFQFVGLVAHGLIPRYLSLMDIVVSPYRGDYLFYGSSMKLLEYLAAGKVVLAPALGQIKEVVQDGYNGMLHEPDDWVGMAEKLKLLIRDSQLRQYLGANARRTIEAGWTWEHQAKRLAKALTQVLVSS